MITQKAMQSARARGSYDGPRQNGPASTSKTQSNIAISMLPITLDSHKTNNECFFIGGKTKDSDSLALMLCYAAPFNQFKIES